MVRVHGGEGVGECMSWGVDGREGSGGMHGWG